MLKKFLLLTCCAALAAGTIGCEKKKPALKPGELTVEQKDKLKLNAIKAYNQIVKDYPDSPQAAGAKQRLQALGPAPAKSGK